MAITVRRAGEACVTPAERQRLQHELIAAQARAVNDGTLLDWVERDAPDPTDESTPATGWATAGNATRILRPPAPASRTRGATATGFDGLDAATLVAQTVDGIDHALKLAGSAIEAAGGLVADIDLGDFDFD